MTFAEKLAKLTEDENKQKLSAKAGLPETAISNYITKGNVPRLDKALALARALGVPLDWLADDGQDYPPPSGARVRLSQVPHDDLMMEVCRRYRLEAMEYHSLLNRIEAMDWLKLARALIEADSQKPLPAHIEHALTLARALVASEWKLKHYDASYMHLIFKGMPESNIDPAELDADHLLARVQDIMRRFPAVRLIHEYLSTAMVNEGYPDFAEKMSDVRTLIKRTLAGLERRTAPDATPARRKA